MTGALGVDLSVEFGMDATGPDDETFTWTRRGDVRVDQGVQLTRGRTADSPSIAGGSAALTLDNIDGDYSAGGPGAAIRTGTPVRVQATTPGGTTGAHFGLARFGLARFGVGGGAGTTATIWRGVVDGRAGVHADTVDHTVKIDALDALGLAAQADGPRSVWEATIPTLSRQPDAWWRLGATEWIDRIAGRVARHTAGTIQAQAVIDGDDAPFQSTDLGEGFGVIDDIGFMELAVDNQPILVSMWVRLATEADRTVFSTLLQQLADNGRRQLEIGVDPVTHAFVVVIGKATTCNAWTSSDGVAVNLFDGRPHHILVDGGYNVVVGGDTITELVRVWVDGRPVPMSIATSKPLPTATTSVLLLAGGNPALSGAQSAVGTVDHLMLWNNHPYVDTAEALANQLTTAGRVAWGGDRLDERLTHILSNSGLTALTGALDESSIVTNIGYQVANVLQLAQIIEDTEQGRVWVDREGKIRFARRIWAWSDPTATTVQAWFSDLATDVAGDALPMLADSLKIQDDPRAITNIAEVTAQNGHPQSKRDQASITAYGQRNPLSLSGLLHQSDRESLSIAEWLVLSHATPQTRIQALSFMVAKDPRLAALLLAIDIGHLVKVTSRGVDLFGHVVGINDTIDATGWVRTLELDGTRTGYTFFRCDISTSDGPDGVAF